MALNITLDGYTYDKDETISNSDIKYQGLFFPDGTSSSVTTWNNVRTVESTGYYNINLGDADWLGQDGVALSTAKVIIVFWKGSPLGDDRNVLCNVLDEWGAFEVILDGSSVYSQDSQIEDNIYPVLQWNHNVPPHGYVDTLYSTTNTSYDVHAWSFDGIATSGTVTMNHWRTRYGEDIQLINTVSGTDYYWGDTTSDLDLSGAAGSSHQWSTAGTYDIDIEVYDECDATVSGVSQIDIYWHAPTPDITCNEAAGQNIVTPDTVVSFNYTGGDIDSTISGIDWTINDTGGYGNTTTVISGVPASGTVYHTNGQGTSWGGHPATSGAFTNPGNHIISIVVNWYDGHSMQIANYNETFNQLRFNGPPVANITCNEAVGQNVITPDTIVSFNYTGTNPDSRITGIDWHIYDSGVYGNTDTVVSGIAHGTVVNHTEGIGTDWCGHTTSSGAFTNPESHLVDIDVNWNDGWDNNKVDYDESFNQQKFTGPAMDFEQAPLQATIGSGIEFTNTSTDVSRVGLGLPDCTKYDWEWNDSGSIETELDKLYSYKLVKTPVTPTCLVELCADWSDGWDTQQACEQKNVVFKTTVTITEEDCYYNFNVIGTSSDGSATGYHWEVYKDLTCSGTCQGAGGWQLVWEGPVGLDQQNKDMYFTEPCCYRVYGYVHGTGTTTNDYEDIYISEVCTMSGVPTCSGVVPQSGMIELESGWQLVAVPVQYGYWDATTHQHVHDEVTVAKFKNYVLDQITDLHGAGVVEIANTFTGDHQAFYSYVVGSTPEGSPHNFSMVYEDGLKLEISGFWIKIVGAAAPYLVVWGEE